MWSRFMRYAVAVTATAAVLGCATQKAPAEKAIASADTALQAVSADAKMYVPDQFTAASEQLAAAKSDLDAKKYGDALTKAQDAAAKVTALGPAIKAKQNEVAKNWQMMSDSLPGMVQMVQKKVDELSKMRRLPAGMDSKKLGDAKNALQGMKDTWAQAMDAYKGGNVMDAVAKANTVKSSAMETMQMLGMKAM
jgi:hypothetical protein